MAKFKAGDSAKLKGKKVEITAVSGGWSTVILPNGSTRKVRNGELTAIGASTRTKRDGASRRKSSDSYDREQVNAQIAADREEGKTRVYPDLSRYEQVEAANGRKVLDNGDEVAAMLREAATVEDVYKIAGRVMGRKEAAALREKYDHLNAGMQRMNVGNRLRGFLRRQQEA